MDEAIFATLIAAMTVLVPRRLVDELLERAVVLIGDEIAGALPTFGVVSRIAPCGAHQLAIAREEFGVDRRVADRILFRDTLEVFELFADGLAVEEYLFRLHGGIRVA